MNTYHSQTAYWYGYEAAITGKPKPKVNKHQNDVDVGYAEATEDMKKQILEAMREGVIWK